MKKPRISQRAKELHTKFRRMKATWRALWVQYGRYGVEFDDDNLYREYGFGSFKAYWNSLPDAMPYSTMAEAMAVLRAFPKMKDEELVKFPKENLKVLAKLPRKKQLQYMTVAKTMKQNELVDLVNERDNQHLEKKTRRVFVIEQSVNPVVDEALEMMRDFTEDSTGEEINDNRAFELIMCSYVSGDMIIGNTKTKTAQTRGRALNME